MPRKRLGSGGIVPCIINRGTRLRLVVHSLTGEGIYFHYRVQTGSGSDQSFYKVRFMGCLPAGEARSLSLSSPADKSVWRVAATL